MRRKRRRSRKRKKKRNGKRKKKQDMEEGTDKSYGIHLARLAGVPKDVIERAKVILHNLEESELTPEGNVRQPARHRAEREKLQQLPPPQMDLFS